jgi:FAD/FMN-containing dehydrogenase
MTIPDRLTGKMIGPEHPRYPVLRSTYVAPASPAAVVVAEDELDIAAALNLARTNEWQVSVRSGGHGLSVVRRHRATRQRGRDRAEPPQ